jgi:hypothetical protein
MTHPGTPRQRATIIDYYDLFEGMSVEETAAEVAAIVGEPVSLWSLPLPPEAPTGMLLRETRPGRSAINHAVAADYLSPEMWEFAARHELAHVLRGDHLTGAQTASAVDRAVLAVTAEHLGELPDLSVVGCRKVSVIGCRQADEAMAAAEQDCELFATLLGASTSAPSGYHRLARSLQAR